MGRKFDLLKEHVAREYEDKGYDKARAEKIGESVAGRIARVKGKAPGQEEHHQETPPA